MSPSCFMERSTFLSSSSPDAECTHPTWAFFILLGAETSTWWSISNWEWSSTAAVQGTDDESESYLRVDLLHDRYCFFVFVFCFFITYSRLALRPTPLVVTWLLLLSHSKKSGTCLMFSSNEGQPSLVHVDFYSFQSNLSTHRYSNQV